MFEIATEGEWLTSLDASSKCVFLASVGHQLTIAGRNSYAVQAEGLDKPSQLRRINEMQHRVLACLCEVLSGISSASFERSIAVCVLDQTDVELGQLMCRVWHTAKEQARQNYTNSVI
ncbi:MAG: hypothetical protein MUF80_09505 [Burkholderiales bacterium]|jgi:hypothetical protein|nr:hypothetical protein [Burkholderiales bacterium]